MNVTQNGTEQKAKNFFEYLLALNSLVGKVTRDYREFEKNWPTEEFKSLPGCYLFDQCEDEDTFLEIHRPEITREDETPPPPDPILSGWIDFDYRNERRSVTRLNEKTVLDDDENEITIDFSEDPIRVTTFESWENKWNSWAERLREKKKVNDLYVQYFDLIQQLEKEGETLEFIFARGLFCWQHPDEKVGTIRYPLLTTKLELELDAEKGIISIKQVQVATNVEREMFSGVRINNIEKINELNESIQTTSILDNLDTFFTQYIHLFDPNGKFIEDHSKIEINEHPAIYDESFFSLRRKSVRVLRDDLEKIINGIVEGDLEVTAALQAIVGEQSEAEEGEPSEANNDRLDFSANDLYFPLESNEQQKEIVNRIEHNYGVSVQGPPGTGKTHTIANLVSHFLAQGKKILITSQKESPLKVLKAKIPKDIRDLCVPVLGGGRESLQEIEQSIRSLSEKLGELDVHKLEAEMTRNKDLLDQSKRNEARLKNDLRTYAEKEGTPLEYKGEKLFKYDVAKRLAESPISFAWLHDEIEMNLSFPISSPEFRELWDLKGKLQKEDLALVKETLPKVEKDIRNATSFTDLIRKGKELEKSVEPTKQIQQKYNVPLEEEIIKSLLTHVQGVYQNAGILSNSEYKLILDDCMAGGKREERWRTLLSELKAKNEELFELYHSLVTHRINLPNRGRQELAEDFLIAKERLQSGKKPNALFFLFKGKRTKYLFETSILNGESIRTVEDIELLEQSLSYQQKRDEAARVFNGNMTDVQMETINLEDERFPHALDQKIQQLDVLLKVVDAIEAFKEEIKPYTMSQLDVFSVETYEQLVGEFEVVLQYVQYEKWLKQLDEEVAQLTKAGNQEDAHPICKDFITAFQTRDDGLWKERLEKLGHLETLQIDVKRFYEILHVLAGPLLLTGQSIEMSVGQTIPFPEDYEEAFELKKLHTWLDETKDMNVGLIKNQIEEEHKEQKRLIQDIVSQSTWKNQIERITESEKRSLSAWKTYIKRFGKGTGKYAHQHLKDARNEMKTAQSAIPVWIMPVNQVLENFPVTNDKFDIIIFDESSQCDLFSINVLMRGKKVIVVGDDEQISPTDIGTKLDDVHELVRRYLNGIPNGNLFDGNISLYEIAEQTFPKEGKLMLREHFRCVPEIIQFSNDLSYGGEMIPLRLPLEEEKIDPPVTAIKVNDGYNDEKDKDINVPEIDAIVADMKEMVKDPKYKGQTFGVIALQGQKQAKLLESKIREALGEKEYVDRKMICGNSYTLQGDERDIIFLSMIVAPGRRFMALTKTSDKQRFNVAASRAKNQMRLYHSLDLEDLNPDDLRYRLLSYCKNPNRTSEQFEDLEDKCDSPFEKDVLRMILARGYKVTPQVVVGRYRIDFVIEGIRDRLAVECDGERWHGPEKFEEDMQRQESLERSGWKFWRVRGREFYFNREKAMESLWEKLAEMGITSNQASAPNSTETTSNKG